MITSQSNTLRIIIFVLLIGLGLFFLMRRSKKRAYDVKFSGVVVNLYVCTKMTLCAELESDIDEHYLGYLGLQKGDNLIIGDSIVKSQNDYALKVYSRNKDGLFQLKDIL